MALTQPRTVSNFSTLRIVRAVAENDLRGDLAAVRAPAAPRRPAPIPHATYIPSDQARMRAVEADAAVTVNEALGREGATCICVLPALRL